MPRRTPAALWRSETARERGSTCAGGARGRRRHGSRNVRWPLAERGGAVLPLARPRPSDVPVAGAPCWAGVKSDHANCRIGACMQSQVPCGMRCASPFPPSCSLFRTPADPPT
eukprot:356902-Chlamydomonas_euryale.AAC.21